VLGDELDEPPWPTQGAVDPALSEAAISSANTGSSAPTPTARTSAEVCVQRIRATAVVLGSAARSTPTVSTSRPYGWANYRLPQTPEDPSAFWRLRTKLPLVGLERVGWQDGTR
jgi:hypothetical protein